MGNRLWPTLDFLASMAFPSMIDHNQLFPTILNVATTINFWLGCDALLCVSHTLQSASESGQEARIVQIDLSTAFDRVNHLDILYKLCSVDIGGSVLSILTQFLSNRSQHVMVDGCLSKLVNVVSGVRQISVLGRYCSSCTLRSFFPIWKISWSLMLMTPL